ncbi:DDE superfamily endonuclease [Ceratobasidium sp. AG-Ba]|nr:DDE superfamily endonuclease [Ceratobasidium sp. AG-Ba]
MFVNDVTEAASLVEVSEQSQDQFSNPHGSDEHEIDVSEPPDPPDLPNMSNTNTAGSHDALAEEHQAIQGSVKAVTTTFKNAPIPRDVASYALEKLECILRPSKEAPPGFIPPKLDDMFSIRRLTSMAACLRFYCNDVLKWSLTYSSEIAALGNGYGIRFGRRLLVFIRTFINTDNLPENQYGTWNASVLEDEDLATEISDYLTETKGRYMRAEDILEYLQRPDVKTRFGLDEPPCLRTAQRWMKEHFGLRWGQDPKGQYVDGHEREDVVDYRNNVYVAIWNDLERRMRWYDSKTMEEHAPNLAPGERPVMVWFHDESMFYANDRRLTRWVHYLEKAKPYAKGEGASIMVADFVGIDGWLAGVDLLSDNARITLFPGRTRDGYLTGAKVRDQLTKAIGIVKRRYPDVDHVFIYDNATTHTRRREDLAAISKMTLQPSQNVGDVIETRTDEQGSIQKIRVRFANVQFPDGSPQSLYFADDHPQYPGYFKGIAELLRERGISTAKLRLQCMTGKKCVAKSRCCARQVLSDQPGFEEQESALEEIAGEHGCRVLFLPKFHCELNPIEQCWGYAKRVYREFPASKSQADLKANTLAALNSVPLDSIRRFFNRSHRFVHAYRLGLSGQAAAWANKKYRGHRMLPPEVISEIEAEFLRQKSCNITPDSARRLRRAATGPSGCVIATHPERDKDR